MKSTLFTGGKIVVGAMLLSLTLGGCATDYGYRHRDGYEPHRCHDGERGNNRGCRRYDFNDPGWRN
jgi:hypothetical protein